MNICRKLYKLLRSHSGVVLNDTYSKLLFDLGITPVVIKNSQMVSFPQHQKGGMIVSADFEMAWAFRFSKRSVNPLHMAALERQHVPIMLRALDKFSIPITWATVGHLLLDSCKKGDHDWMRRIPHFDDHWRFISGDWYDHDPYTNVTIDNAWYAPDLIEQILNSRVKHEIGCHTFSHLDCSYKNCPAGVLDDELSACKIAAQKWGLELKSLVFPGGTAGNFEILKKHGFKIYRMGMSHHLSYPNLDQYGMLYTSSTGSFGKEAKWSADYYVHRYKKMIDIALKTNTIAHFWLHPSVDYWTLHNVFPHVLEYAASLQQRGLLWIGTMGDIANFISAEDR